MAPVGGAPAHVVDRGGRRGDELAEARERSRVDRVAPVPVELAGDERLGLARAAAASAPPSRCTCRPSRLARRASSANEHTAITIALRVPTFANCCGPRARGHAHRRDQLVRREHVALRADDELLDRARAACRAPTASSTSAPRAYSGGSASPAGEDDPRFPPIVPRLRICGEPTVRDAIASPGSASPSSRDRARVRHARADPQPTRPRASQSRQLVHAREVQHRRRAALRAKFISTITSVPPQIGSASGAPPAPPAPPPTSRAAGTPFGQDIPPLDLRRAWWA